MQWNRALGVQALVTVGMLWAVMVGFSTFAEWVETRPGAVLADPVLERLRPKDLTWVIFIALYATLGAAAFSLRRDPERLLAALQAYAVMVALRMLAMYLTPLDPPATTIPLEDPLVRLLGPSQVLTRDLFFSGHTASCSMALIAARGAKLRAGLVLGLCVVALGVLWQHVHYTVDVLAAPAFAYLAWGLTLRARRWVRASAGGASSPR